jgi:hypothetical protein
MTQLRWMLVAGAACLLAVGCEREDRREMGEDMREGVRETEEELEELGERAEVRTREAREDIREETREGMGVVPGGTSGAVAAITSARCEREQRCGNVGSGEEFATSSDCIASVRSDWQEDLNAYECEDGVDQTELSECVQEIRNEDCANPFDTIGRVVACRASDICA